MRIPPLALLLLLLVLAATAGCARNTERAMLDEPARPPEHFVRRPYLVEVTDSTAVIRWVTLETGYPLLRYWAVADTTTVQAEEETARATIALEPLVARTEYGYQVLISDTLWSRAETFRTFPVKGSREPFTFLMFGDSGTLNRGQLDLAERLNAERPALILHAGDLAYPNGSGRSLTDKHFAVYAPLLARAPLYPVMGDHDWRTRGGDPFVRAFTPPRGRGSGSPFYYALTYGNVRFIGLDSKDDEEHAREYGYLGDPASEQYGWLVDQLAEASDDRDIDWIVLFFHHGPYSASKGFSGHGSHLPTRAALVPLIDAEGVSLVFSGHDHDYQRSFPLAADSIVSADAGTVYLVSGGGGGRRLFRGTGSAWFTAHSQQVYHFVRARVDGASRLRIEVVDATGAVIDAFELKPLARIRRGASSAVGPRGADR